MPDIVLLALNARFVHPSLGARSLLANLGPLAARAALVEGLASDRPLDVVERVLSLGPRVVGVGAYVWNAEPVARFVAILKRVAPDVRVVVGGPELAGQAEAHPAGREADVLVVGEGEVAFRGICARLLDGDGPGPRVVRAPPPELAGLALPDALYSDADLAHRFVYLETTRGCPRRCAFCLSSVGGPERSFPADAVRASFLRLLQRGARGFKLVDRSFNVLPRRAESWLRFLQAHWRDGLHLHLEWLPERLSEPLLERLAAFPPGAVQLEVGLQSWSPEVCRRLDRPCRPAVIEQNLARLLARTGVHLHADLIVGLPGEDAASFAAGFDRLVALGVHEIQVGMLKLLPGVPLHALVEPHRMRFDPDAPYEVLATDGVPFAELQHLKRFARAWDLVGNSGNFQRTRPRLLAGSSPFDAFDAFARALWRRLGRTSGVALETLVAEVFRWLVEERGQPAGAVAHDLAADWTCGGRRGVPECLRPWVPEGGSRPVRPVPGAAGLPERQRRHRSSGLVVD